MTAVTSVPIAFAPVRRESTRQRVYQAIREAILSGALRTGQRLLEIPLARQFAVSRAVLREALQQLASEGLVEQNSYKGTRVIRLTPEQVDEIVSVRLLLESEAVRLACRRLADEDRRDLRRRARAMAAESDPVRFGQLDLDLHKRVWQLAGNSALAKVLEQLTVPLFAMSMLMRTKERQGRAGKRPLRRGDHTPLVEAICGADAEAAVEAIRFHLTENWAAIHARMAEFLAQEQDADRRF